MSDKLLAIIEGVGLTIFGVGLIVGALTRSSDTVQGLMLSLGVPSVMTGGPRIYKAVISNTGRGIPKLVTIGKIFSGYLVITFFIYVIVRAAPFLVQRYFLTALAPNNGEILYFPTSGKIKPITTWFGTQCSLLSDSVFNQTSRVSYQVIFDPSFDPQENFLRIKADLAWEVGPSGADEPYVGIFCPLALPPEKEYFDVSRFKKIELKGGFHWDNRNEPQNVEVRLVIYSDTVCSNNNLPYQKGGPSDYLFPYVGINSGILPPNGQFTVIPLLLDSLRCHYPPAVLHVDLQSVYQIGIIIVGKPTGINATIRRERTGYLDIAELRFSP